MYPGTQFLSLKNECSWKVLKNGSVHLKAKITDVLRKGSPCSSPVTLRVSKREWIF